MAKRAKSGRKRKTPTKEGPRESVPTARDPTDRDYTPAPASGFGDPLNDYKSRIAQNQRIRGGRFMFQSDRGEVIHGCLPYETNEMRTVLPARVEEDEIGYIDEDRSVSGFERQNNTTRIHRDAAAAQLEAQKRLDKIAWLKSKGYLNNG